MKTNRIILTALAVLACACTKQVGPYEAGEGTLSVTAALSQDTKAAYTADQLLQNARVNIFYADFSGLVRTYLYSDVPQTIYLPANEYRVDVIAGEAAKENPARASWEQKSYKGSSNFAIEAGHNTSVQVLAGVNNAIAKASFGDGVADNFNAGYKLTIGVGEDVLVYDASKSGAEGYFIITGVEEPAFDWTFDGVLSKDGSTFTKSGTINGIEAGKVYTLALRYTVKDGLGSFELFVDYSTTTVDDTIIFEPVSSGLAPSSPYEIWAGHATLHADVDESEYPDPSAVKFAVSKDGQNWTVIDATRTGDGTYEAVAAGLDPGTEYSYKLVVAGEDLGDPMTFTTEQAIALPNASFEYDSKSKSGNYQEWYNPSAPDLSCTTAWWGSGNGSEGVNGSADFGGFVICKPDTSEKVDGNQSACLISMWALVKFAAGNLFSGNFAGLVGTKGGKVNFGRPFTARPTALKVWLKYSTGKVNRIADVPAGENVTTNDYDRARVMIALGTWDSKTYGGTKESPIQVNTTDVSTFVDYTTDQKTIAYGELTLQGDAANSYDSWVEYTIPLNYRSMTTYPTHIVINCASSMLGDYFTGCDSSKLWVDKMELVYE